MWHRKVCNFIALYKLIRDGFGFRWFCVVDIVGCSLYLFLFFSVAYHFPNSNIVVLLRYYHFHSKNHINNHTNQAFRYVIIVFLLT